MSKFKASSLQAWDFSGKTTDSTTAWVEDDWPAGAAVNGAQDFTWTTTNPLPYSGARARQTVIAAGVHQHYFTNATATISLGAGDKLFTYVYLDPANPPKEVMRSADRARRASGSADRVPN